MREGRGRAISQTRVEVSGHEKELMELVLGMGCTGRQLF